MRCTRGVRTTAPRSACVPPVVVRTLYRTTLRLLAYVERCDAVGSTCRHDSNDSSTRGHMTALALQRWAEFVPHDVIVAAPSSSTMTTATAATHTLRAVARRCFAQAAADTTRAMSSSSSSVASAFDFVKEATASLTTLELLARWQVAVHDEDKHSHTHNNDNDSSSNNNNSSMVTYLALCSAALQLHSSSPSRVLQSCIAHYAAYAHDVVQRALVQLSTPATTDTAATTSSSSRQRQPRAHTQRGAAVAVWCAVRRAAPLRRREAVADDYSLVSAEREGVCAEAVLNALLQCVYDAHGVWATCLVGLDTLPFAWLRLSPRAHATAMTASATSARARTALYVSWSYGVHTRTSMARLMRMRGRRLSLCRKSGSSTAAAAACTTTMCRRVCCMLLQRQLACLSTTQLTAAPSHDKNNDSDDNVSAAAVAWRRVEADARRASLCKEQLLYLLST